MAKLKVDNVISTLSKEFKAPCNYNDYGNYLKGTCTIGGDEECSEKCDYNDCWKKLFELKEECERKGLTIEQLQSIAEQPVEKKTRAKRSSVTSQELLEIDCWSNKLYENAYDIVKDRLFPVVIPTYNRPNCGFLKWVTNVVQPGYEYPIYLVVRRSQKELYEASEYVKYHDYIHVKAFPDEMIDDIGKVRQQIVNAFSKQYDNIFMFDDDIVNFCHSVPYFRSNGEPKAQGVKCVNFGKVMAMWQIAHEYACAKYDIAFSTGMLQGFSWLPDFIKVENSIRILSGLPTLAVCVHLKKLVSSGLNYRTIIGNGHDDIDLLIRCLQNGLLTAEFRWMIYGSPGIGTDILHFNSVEERFTKQQAEMKQNFGDVEFVKWTHVRGLDNVGINWKKVREMYKEKGIIDLTDKNYFDFWNDGKVLEDAKNNFKEI